MPAISRTANKQPSKRKKTGSAKQPVVVVKVIGTEVGKRTFIVKNRSNPGKSFKGQFPGATPSRDSQAKNLWVTIFQGGQMS